ncbi:MAG: hypothetical protein IPK83_13810 [Planctomycetes bacterium]|nr:hypothetical protein [Planctomycetota bacterium]
MQFRIPLRSKNSALMCGLGVASAIFLAACSHVNDPFKDSSATIDAEMTTASAEGYKGKREFYVPLHRRGDTTQVNYENGSTTHWPLWFEDPFEDKGNDVTDPDDRDPIDNRFALTWADFLHMGYGPGRMLLNILGYPFSAAVTPPGTLMESDGRLDKNILGYDHDAKRSDSASREPPDGHHLTRDTNIPASDDSASMPDEKVGDNATSENAPS